MLRSVARTLMCAFLCCLPEQLHHRPAAFPELADWLPAVTLASQAEQFVPWLVAEPCQAG
jgi:hypothetical protein